MGPTVGGNETTDGVTRMLLRGQADVGITSVAVHDGLVKCIPLYEYGYFLVSMTQAFIPNPAGSQGNLCIAGQIGRFAKQGQSSGPSGEFTIQVDLTSLPTHPPHTVMAGETWNFQAWFRDKNPGSTTNFTDAVSVLFQ